MVLRQRWRLRAGEQSTRLGDGIGAGGIGATLNTSFERYEFDTAAAILLMIIAIVMAVEYSSTLIRARLR